jgi:formate dehydrogenase maturation protein FdhE
MHEDAGLDSFMEDHLNGGYGHIMDAADSFCPICNSRPCRCDVPDAESAQGMQHQDSYFK